MLAAVPQPLEVEQVGDDPWGILIGLAGPLLIAGAAAFAAFLAARTARVRQSEQLAHDLAVRRNEYIRDALDETAVAIHEAAREVSQLANAVKEIEKLPVPQADGFAYASSSSAPKGIAEERYSRARDRVLDLAGCKVRVGLRLGREDPIAVAIELLRAIWIEEISLLWNGMTKGRDSEELQRSQSIEVEAASAYREVHEKIEGWLRHGSDADR